MSIIFDNAFEKQASIEKIALSRWKKELVLNNPNIDFDPTKVYNTNNELLTLGVIKPHLTNNEILDAIRDYENSSARTISDIKLKVTPSIFDEGRSYVVPDWGNPKIMSSRGTPNNNRQALFLNRAVSHTQAINDSNSVLNKIHTPEELKLLSKRLVLEAKKERGYNTRAGGVLPKDIPNTPSKTVSFVPNDIPSTSLASSALAAKDIPTTSPAPASLATKLKNFAKANPRLAGGTVLGTAALGGYGLYRALNDD